MYAFYEIRLLFRNCSAIEYENNTNYILLIKVVLYFILTLFVISIIILCRP